MSRDKGDITFFICHVTRFVDSIIEFCDFVNKIFPLQATSLSSFVATGEVEK